MLRFCAIAGVLLATVVTTVWAVKPQPPAVDQRTALLLDAARTTAQLLATKLRVALKEALAAKGPAEAIAACSELAPNLAQEIAFENGWRVTRVSLKPRNALLGTPDAWEQKTLLDFEARKAKGEALATMEETATLDEPAGRYFRYVKAVPTEGACLVCHGPAEGLAPEVKSILEKRYPHDRATGFNVGDIRGAVSIKIPLH